MKPSRAKPDPSATIETRDELERALSSLSEGQRATVVLVEWLGLDAETAARILRVQPVTVRVRISRARTAIREIWKGSDEENGAER